MDDDGAPHVPPLPAACAGRASARPGAARIALGRARPRRHAAWVRHGHRGESQSATVVDGWVVDYSR
eukprot:5745232-Prymnesium_polylepis.1